MLCCVCLFSTVVEQAPEKFRDGGQDAKLDKLEKGRRKKASPAAQTNAPTAKVQRKEQKDAKGSKAAPTKLEPGAALPNNKKIAGSLRKLKEAGEFAQGLERHSQVRSILIDRVALLTMLVYRRRPLKCNTTFWPAAGS